MITGFLMIGFIFAIRQTILDRKNYEQKTKEKATN
jgi:hypothetical protein